MHPTSKGNWRVLKKLEVEPPLDPTIPLFSIFMAELKSAYYRDTCFHKFIAAQFIKLSYRHSLGAHQEKNRFFLKCGIYT